MRKYLIVSLITYDYNREIKDFNLDVSHNINKIKYILEYKIYTLKEEYFVYYAQKY